MWPGEVELAPLDLSIEEVIRRDELLGREFLAAMIEKVENEPYTGAPAEGWEPNRCPGCGAPLKRVTPQHAERDGTTVGETHPRYLRLGVNQPVEVRIHPNLKDLFPKEEVASAIVAGARKRDVRNLAVIRLDVRRHGPSQIVVASRETFQTE